MGDITEDVVLAHQQQSTEDKTELCIGVQLADNDKMRGSKQELVVTIHKMVEIEDRSESCFSKIVRVDEESIPEMTNISQQQQQQQEQPYNDGEFCIGLVLPIIIVPGKLVVKLSTVIRGDILKYYN